MLKQLQLELKMLETQSRKIKENLMLVNSQMENVKATQYDKEFVSGLPQRQDINDLLHKKDKMLKELDFISKELFILKKQIDELEGTLKTFNERKQLIWLQKNLKNYSIPKIAMLNNITERTVYRELKELNRVL